MPGYSRPRADDLRGHQPKHDLFPDLRVFRDFGVTDVRLVYRGAKQVQVCLNPFIAATVSRKILRDESWIIWKPSGEVVPVSVGRSPSAKFITYSSAA